MSIPVIAFFNNKGGIGKTSLVYHLAWMYADQGLRVVAADLDPQSNLTSARIMSAFWRIMQKAATEHNANVILMDLGPNLGAINRAALIASDYVVVPLSPDLFSLQGLRNLGPTLRKWRHDWRQRLTINPVADLLLPTGRMQPVGYIVLQHAVRMDRPVKAYDRWIAHIPDEYQEYVLDKPENNNIQIQDDPNCLALLKHYRSLMPLAQEAHKPMFYLKPADGAMGSHMHAVQSAYTNFNALALKIIAKTGIETSV